MAPALFVLLLLRSTALYRYAVAFLSYVDIAFTFYCLKPNFVLFHLTVDIAFTSYCPVRAALTFVGCDKSKQKRAFVPVSFYERVRSGGEIFLLLPLSEIILR